MTMPSATNTLYKSVKEDSLFPPHADTFGFLSSQWIALITWGGAAALIAVLGLNIEQSALQVRPVAHVAPIIFVLELALPIALGAIVGGENWPTDPARNAILLASLLLSVGGAFSLMRSGPVAAVLVAEQEAEAARPEKPQPAAASS